MSSKASIRHLLEHRIWTSGVLSWDIKLALKEYLAGLKDRAGKPGGQ
jgi:hypothetical protein